MLNVHDPAGREVHGSTQDASFIYPASSPLPGGGNAVVDHVAARNGLHYVTVIGGEGRYDVTLEVYRPGPQAAGVTQTLFLDFDGQRVNTDIFGGPGVRQLSPLSAFLGRWGIPASQLGRAQDRIVSDRGRERPARLRRRRGRVSRAQQPRPRRPVRPAQRQPADRRRDDRQSGIPTIGIAQSIDPGNFETEETALILLDVVSDPPDEDPGHRPVVQRLHRGRRATG